MLDPTLQTGLYQALAKALNYSLQYDPGTQQQLRKFVGKRLAVHLSQPELSAYLIVGERDIEIISHCEEEVDCELTGSASALLTLLTQDHQSLANSGVKVRGDIAFLSQVQTTLKNLDIDWEEALGDVLGETTATVLAAQIRKKLQWTQQRVKALPEWLPIYLSEELQAIPTSTQLQEFYSGVQKAVQETDRLEAKIKRLQNILESSNANKPEATGSAPKSTH